jgi:YfiH family protein|tara:strand:+ start:420 stop:1169 length:750 start_codon:yes stop_codon:yes gene_type:complete
MKMMNDNYFYPKWNVPNNIKSIQTQRQSGSSSGCFSSFNLSYDVGDNQTSVNRNLITLNSYLPASPYWLNQIHENIAIELPCDKSLLDADASFTMQKKIVCAVRTADCLPILLTNVNGDFVSAIHAGWRSLASGIIENTLNKVKSKSQIIAWLGPSISESSYEVGEQVYDIFTQNDPDSKCGFKKLRTNKYLLDLPKIALVKLRKKGVSKLFGAGVDESFCTYRDNDSFYSYRRDGSTGRMASLIWIDS